MADPEDCEGNGPSRTEGKNTWKRKWLQKAEMRKDAASGLK